MLAPLSNNSLMMSQCPCWHATWRAVWPSASSSICAERKESNPWPRQTFLNATKLKFDSRSFKKYPFSKRIFTKTWVTQFSSYAHISHIASILENCRDMLILSAGVEGMKEKSTRSGLASKISLSLERLLLLAAFTRPGSSCSWAWPKKSLKRLKGAGGKENSNVEETKFRNFYLWSVL